MDNLYKEMYSAMDQCFTINRLIRDEKGNAEDYVILEANHNYGEMIGMAVKDIVGSRICNIMPDFNRKWLKAIDDVVKGTDIKRYEKYSVELDRFYEISILPNDNEQFALIYTDVTENKRKERQMASLIEELTASEEEIRGNYLEMEKVKNNIEEEHRRKLHFLTSLNQQIKMPLNGVLAFCRLLVQTNIDDGQQKYLSMIQNSCDRAMELMDRLMENVDENTEYTGSMEPSYKRFKVRDSILRVAKEFAVICDNKNLKFNFNMENHIPMTVIGDELMVSQVLVELLNNFVNNTSEGEISLKVYKIFQVDKKVTLKFELKDTGLKLKNADNGLEENIIPPSAQELIKMLNGQLWLEESQDIAGEILFFTAEFLIDTAKLPDISEMDHSLDIDLKNIRKRILVVEENHINMKIVTELLRRHGYEIISTSSGIEAVQYFTMDKIDLMLIDVHTSDQDGYETAKMVRTLEKAMGTHVPIIGTMATAPPGTRELCINAGIEDYILKPFEVDKLYRVIESYISRGEASVH